jgi:1-acyl-sn-glycerol-3-phosphate acyltransferase
VFLSVLGISWFWFYGATFLAQFPNYSKDVLGGYEQVATLLLAIFSVGAGAGALLCERLSGHKVEIGLVPFGSIGLTLFALDLYFASPSATLATAGAAEFLARPGSWRVVFDLALIGVFGSFYIVPLYALIQTRAEKSHQSRIIAGNNLLNALFMVVSAGMAIALLALGVTIPQLFLVIALLNAVVAVYIYTLVPEFLMRFLVWLLVHTAYRVEKSGVENIPEEGPAVIVCNHVSHVDALIIAAACRRPIRFVADHALFRVPVLGFVLRTARAIPIAAARDDPALLERAYDEIARTLEAGGIVGMFPEGRVSEDGEISFFRRGMQRIIERTPVPVVPMALRGLWGSVFSHRDGSTMIRRLCKALSSRVALVVSAPVAPQAATPEALQARVSALRGDFR